MKRTGNAKIQSWLQQSDIQSETLVQQKTGSTETRQKEGHTLIVQGWIESEV